MLHYYQEFFRTYENYSRIYHGLGNHEFWGVCKPECMKKAERPVPQSKYNIAKDNEVFNTAWSYGLYNMARWAAGFCFTYDPPEQSRSGVSNGLFFMLGHKHLIKEYANDSKYLARDSSYLLYSFNVYLHEKVGSHLNILLSSRSIGLEFRVNFG